MRDWAGNMEARNYGIRRQTDRRNLSELLWIIFSLAVIAGVFFCHSWVRSRIVDLGYEQQALQKQEEELNRMKKNLILEEATLKNPERIDAIARNDLGMTRVQTNQVLSPQFQDMELPGSTKLAMADISRGSDGTRKQ